MMLDIKKIREEYKAAKKAIESRGQGSFGIENILQLDEKRRGLLATVEQMKNKQNVDSKEIPVLKKQGKDTAVLMSEMKQLSDEIKKLDSEVGAVEEEIKNTLLYIPNMPQATVPVGKDENDNLEIRKWGEPRTFDFEPVSYTHLRAHETRH